MTLVNYWWIIIWPLLFVGVKWFLSRHIQGVTDSQGNIYWSWYEALILGLPYVIWAGWRKGFGDTEQYRDTFQHLPDTFAEIGPYMKTVEKGRGFRLLECLFRCFVSHSDLFFFTLIAAFQIVCLLYIYHRYSTNFWISFFFFVASTDYLTWMHNGIRQFVATVIIFFCVPLIAENRYIFAVILILIASTIHATCLIFLPFIFIVNGRAWNTRTVLFIIAIAIAVLYVDQVTGILTSIMEETPYERDIILLETDGGTNVLRALFYSVPAIMTLIFRPYIDRANEPLLNICANLSIMTAGFYFFSIFTSGILMGSIPIYFSLSNYILIPWLIREAFHRDSVIPIEIIFTIVYIAFFWFQCGPTWHLL